MTVTGVTPWPRPPMPPCPPARPALWRTRAPRALPVLSLAHPLTCPAPSSSLSPSRGAPPWPRPARALRRTIAARSPPGRIKALHSLLPFVCFVLAEGIEARRFEAAVMPTSSPMRPRIAVTLAVVPCGPRTNRPRRMPRIATHCLPLKPRGLGGPQSRESSLSPPPCPTDGRRSSSTRSPPSGPSVLLRPRRYAPGEDPFLRDIFILFLPPFLAVAPSLNAAVVAVRPPVVAFDHHARVVDRPCARPGPAMRPAPSGHTPACAPDWAGSEAGLLCHGPGLHPGLGRPVGRPAH